MKNFKTVYEKRFGFWTSTDDCRKPKSLENSRISIITPEGYELAIYPEHGEWVIENTTYIKTRTENLKPDEKICPWCEAEAKGFSREGAACAELVGHVECTLCD